MNFHMNPDMLYELNRIYQQERLKSSEQLRLLPSQQANGRTLKDQMLLSSGELFITFGQSLKGRAAKPICHPQTV